MANAPHHVEVPPELQDTFAPVEALVDAFFADLRARPDLGRIDIRGERYVLVRGAALSVEFFGLVRGLFGPERQAEGDAFSRNFLFDLAHALGRSDARRFHDEMGLTDPLARLSAGPVQFAHTGWARVRLLPASHTVPGPDWVLAFDHLSSFEADAWQQAGQVADTPSCMMSAGYSSGWVSESLGQELLASELRCKACGHEECTFVMAPPDRIEDVARRLLAQVAPLATLPAGLPDFFARKRTEDELRRAHDVLEERVRARTAELEATVRRLEEEKQARERAERNLAQAMGLDAIGKLAGGIAHDFGNIVAVIANRIELLEMDGEESRHVDAIRMAAERAIGLTDQLRRLSRGQEAQPRLVRVEPVLSELVKLADRSLGQGVRVHLRPGRHAGQVWMDQSQLDQVVLNLMMNARDAMPDGGRIRVGSELIPAAQLPTGVDGQAAGQWVRVDVHDEGHGMERETLARIFEPSFTTKAARRGTGLGLATVSSIVERARGSITVQSQVGAGSTFTVWLPHHDAPPSEPDVWGGL